LINQQKGLEKALAEEVRSLLFENLFGLVVNGLSD